MSSIQDPFLHSALREIIFFPKDEAYKASTESYLSAQESKLRPYCIIRPRSTAEVSAVIKTLHSDTMKDVKFAVRSGGNMVWPGAANIQDGVTLDLSAISQVVLSEDKRFVTIGTGALWGEVYKVLEGHGLAVIGGRVACVGVGGLVLGGGIAWHSAQKGFVCDNVLQYEIVFADGRTTQVTRDSDPDLFWALKGGSSYFGIVTHFTMPTFHQEAMWGGCYFYSFDHAAQNIREFHRIADADPYDEHASLICTFSYTAAHGMGCLSSLYFTEPVENPPIFQPFTKDRPIFGTGRVTTLSDLAEEQAKFAEKGLQQYYATTSFVNDIDIMGEVLKIWNSFTSQIANVPGVCWSTGYQPLPPSITRRSVSLGGNALGVESSPTLVIALLVAFWEREEDSALLYNAAQTTIREIEKLAKSRSLYSDFKYLNYAWSDQDPIDGYGEENVEKLRAVGRRVDPGEFFQTRMPGGFKLPLLP